MVCALSVPLAACKEDEETTTAEPTLTPKYLYLADAGSDQIEGYTVNASTGALTALTNAPWATSVSSPTQFAIHPDGTYLYVSGSTLGHLGSFAIDPDTGDLTEVGGTPFATFVAGAEIPISSDGDHIYSTYGGANSASAWKTESDGTLSQVQTVSLAPASPNTVALSTAGDFLIVGTFTPDLRVFFVTPGGGLSFVAGSPLAFAGTPQDIEFTPDDQFVYVSESTSNRVYSYQFDTDSGTLTATTPAFVSTGGTSIRKMTVDPAGTHLYVSSSSSVFIYDIGTDGTLTAAATASIAVTGDSWGMTLNAGGDYLYRSESSNALIRVYGRNASTGALTETTDSPYTTLGSFPNGFAIRYDYE